MNIKSLLLGSAAALVAATGAQAADAVVIADPEPVEYVRVCDVYGTGYFYIPGTETCLRIGGYVRYQVSGGDLWELTVRDHLDDPVGVRSNETYRQQARFSFQTWTGTETELGTLKTFTEVRFNYENGVGANGDNVFGSNSSLNFAWIELGGFRIGKDESAYTTFLGYAGNVIADDIIGYGPFDTNLISYTFTSGAFSGIVSVEAGSESFGHSYGIDSYVPHVVAGAKFTQDWGGIGLVAGYDSIHEQFAVKARLDIKATESISGFLMAGWAENDDFNFYAPWGGDWAIWGGVSAQVSEKAKINLQVSYDEEEELAAALNVNYDIVPGLRITPEIDYFDNGVDDAFGGIIRFQRSF